MVASFNHQNYQSQSEQQIQVGSQVESHTSFNGMSSSLPKGSCSIFLNKYFVSAILFTYVYIRLDYTIFFYHSHFC